MSKKEYDIDDILLEAEKLKNKAKRDTVVEDELASLKSQYKDKEPDKDKKLEKEDSSNEKKNSFSFSKEEVKPPTDRFDFSSSSQGFADKAKEGFKARSQGPATRPPKKDLFDFTPEKRETPIKTDLYGQKRFDFSKPDREPKHRKTPQPEFEPTQDSKEPDYDATFDFDSISEKIDKLNEQEQKPKSPREQIPFDFEGPVQSISDKAKSRNRYADLASGKKPRRFSFDFNKTAPPRPEDEDVESSETPTDSLEDTLSSTSHTRRSLFSTFTGTGKELKLEDIKKIDFGEVEGAGGGYYENDYYLDDLPEGATMEFSEFRPETDRRDVSRDIANTKLGFFIRTLITGVITFILFYFVLAAKHPVIPMLPFIQPEASTMKAYLTACTVLVGAVGIVCINTVWSGLLSTFTMKANSDSLPTFAIIGAVIQGIVAVKNPDLVQLSAMSLYFPVAALAMLFNCIGKLSMLGRIQQNFRVIASKQEKNTVLAVDDAEYIRKLTKDISSRKPTVAYSAKTEFFSDFLALSFSNKYDVGINRSVAPVCLVAAIVVGVLTRFLSGNPMTAATAFAAVLCICSTLSTAFIENIPLGKMAKKLTPMGAMVSGNKAVEKFCDTNAVILDENDLFPKGHVYLNGIKAFPNARIDEAILDAASVLCALNGPLSHVFLDMIGGDRKLLKKVDNVVYEDGMGLSGWVDERRVLIGNRKLMQNHGIPLPADSYERANPDSTPGNPIYLSNSGEVSARFLVEYLIDEELAYQLDLLAEKDKQLVVYTTDANIDEHKISELYGYPLELITVMPSEMQDQYREMSVEREESPAEIAYIGRPAGFIAAILATINARASILSATVIQLVQIILGYGLVALMSFMGYIETFSMMQLTVYQLFWFIAIMIVQQSRKP